MTRVSIASSPAISQKPCMASSRDAVHVDAAPCLFSGDFAALYVGKPFAWKMSQGCDANVRFVPKEIFCPQFYQWN